MASLSVAIAPVRLRPSRPWRVALAALVLTIAGFAASGDAQMYEGQELVQPDLIADTTAISAGKSFTVGLRLKMAPHWHTYWQYTGDAGLPTKIDWQLPAGYIAGPIQWPLPEKIVSPGDIINYGYGDEVVLLTQITPPATAPAGTDVTLKAKATWLVCAEICVPGEKELSLKLPVGSDAQAANAEVFAKYRAELPATDLSRTPVKAVRTSLTGDALKFVFDWQAAAPLFAATPPAAGKIDFYPLPGETADVDHPSVVVTAGGSPSIEAHMKVTTGLEAADQIGGVLVIPTTDGKRLGFVVPSIREQTHGAAGPAGPSTAGRIVPAPDHAAASAASPANTGSLAYFLLLGFLGGLILNVMPCVLPVISLKLFSFVKQANEAPARVFRLGLAYAAGVFTWFLGFAALVVILRAAGHQVGYAFHLQNPWFLVGLSAATFVFALNLLGVFEIVLPGTVTNAAGVAGNRDGYAGAFVQGVLATVLGSACTAPVFGEALAFAFSQSALGIFAMFTAIAAGMSAPFVLLAAQPGWLKFLPKPGVWMERFKQGTGFVLLATVLWLLLTLGHSKGPDGVVWTGALLLALGIGCWVQGTFNTFAASERSRWAARGVIAVLVLGGGWWCVQEIAQARPAEAVSGASFRSQLNTALKSGRTVFVDFTADWCVSCKVNERVVLASEPVQKALVDDNVMFLKADYTVASDEISDLLKHFNAATVPLYVIYPAGKPDAPVVLPFILTQRTVLDALAAASLPAATSKPVAAR